MFLGMSNVLQAQTPLTVDAGKDTSYCFDLSSYKVGKFDSLILGGKPTATGGTMPYSYSWIMYSKSTKKHFTCLADSNINNIANPILLITHNDDGLYSIDSLNDIFVFKISVTDKNNVKADDSCIIKISRFKDYNLAGGEGMCLKQITSDSIQIYPCNIQGGLPPYSSYEWNPKTGLSNAYIEKPYTYSHAITSYSVTFKDDAGCTLKGYMTITDIKNGDLKTGYVSYKNPVSSSGTMNFTSELIGSTIRISSVTGTVLYQTKIEEPSIPLGSIIKTPGIYYYTVATTQGKVISGSFIKE